MTAGKNYNVQTKSVRPIPAAGSAVSVGTIVPTGMKRYVTFVHVSRIEGATGKGVKIYIASTAASGATLTLASASTSAKMIVILASAVMGSTGANLGGGPGNLSIPDRINTNKPLFSIAEGKYLSVRQASTVALGNGAAAVFIQYYDQ